MDVAGVILAFCAGLLLLYIIGMLLVTPLKLLLKLIISSAIGFVALLALKLDRRGRCSISRWPSTRSTP